eukprot:TRINITY_DN43985_c0_g1_i2.p1 TRINITY_DN43985_c0_g1~~TRINITY_DN43985_c0_g1_i2.p1  ORF type:complete len:315 (+),score=62.22 TRINITY_DN43985_c0_g1_i2:112-1056(+)
MLDVVWMGKGWRNLIPRFQACLDKELGPNTSTIRVASRLADGSLHTPCLQGANVLIPTMERCCDEHLAAAGPDLKLVYQPATGYDNISVDACGARSIPMCNAPGQNANAVAEAAVMLMLSVARKLPQSVRLARETVLGEPQGMELRGKRVGVIGASGASGRIFSQICAGGFGMTVVETNSKSTREELEQLLSSCQVISLHCPLTPETNNLLSRREFELMQQGTILINCARGNLVDREALEQALDNGKLAGYGFDVFWTEPAPGDDPLLHREDVIFTPHTACATEEFFDSIAQLCAMNVCAVLANDLENLKYRIV